MALSYVKYTGDGSNKNFSVTFPYISKDDVAVLVDGISAPFVWLSAGIAQTATAPANGAIVLVQRSTKKDSSLVNFEDASTLTESDLDLANTQLLYLTQEAADASSAEFIAAQIAVVEAKTNAAAASATAANTSQTNAASSATSAASSASAAATSASLAAAALTDFKGRWFGPLASDPTLDPNGNPVTTGDAYFNTTSGKLRVYNGTVWNDLAPSNPLTANDLGVVVMGGVGDGTTDNSVAVQAAIDAAGWRGKVVIPRGVYHCVTAPTNTRGVTFDGPGYITYVNEAGNPNRWDQRGNDYPIVEGREFLGAWFEVVRNGNWSGIKIEFLGDSTTIQEPEIGYRPDLLFNKVLSSQGLAGPTYTNRGVGGATTEDIRVNQMPLTIAATPHLVVLRPGHNDVYSRVTGTKTDAQMLAAAELTLTSLDTMLTSLRSTLTALRLSVVLMTPNSAHITSSTDGREERWYETLTPMFRALARKHKCVFIDTYRALQVSRLMDSQADYSKWLDQPYGANGGGIHPSAVHNMAINDLLVDVVLPQTLRQITQTRGVDLTSTLANGWVKWSGTNLVARRTGSMVNIEGLVTGGTPTQGTVICTLPVGMRPAFRQYFICAVDNTAAGKVYIDPNGTVNVLAFAGATYLGLNACTFMAA